MKKILISLIVFVLLGGCSNTSHSTPATFEPPKGMTAEETVQKFFEYWGENDSVKMNSLMAEQYDGLNYSVWHFSKGFKEDFYFKSVQLLEIKGDTNEPWDSYWGKEPYDYVNIPVYFDFQYRDCAGGYYGWENGHNFCYYHLIKESKTSDWRILGWGNG